MNFVGEQSGAYPIHLAHHEGIIPIQENPLYKKIRHIGGKAPYRSYIPEKNERVANMMQSMGLSRPVFASKHEIKPNTALFSRQSIDAVESHNPYLRNLNPNLNHYKELRNLFVKDYKLAVDTAININRQYNTLTRNVEQSEPRKLHKRNDEIMNHNFKHINWIDEVLNQTHSNHYVDPYANYVHG